MLFLEGLRFPIWFSTDCCGIFSWYHRTFYLCVNSAFFQLFQPFSNCFGQFKSLQGSFHRYDCPHFSLQGLRTLHRLKNTKRFMKESQILKCKALACINISSTPFADPAPTSPYIQTGDIPQDRNKDQLHPRDCEPSRTNQFGSALDRGCCSQAQEGLQEQDARVYRFGAAPCIPEEGLRSCEAGRSAQSGAGKQSKCAHQMVLIKKFLQQSRSSLPPR